MGIRGSRGQWTFDTDVVVVGSGGCGLSAAMAAAQSGAEVVVFEKQQRPWSNTARSGGMIPAAAARFQREAGIEETPADFARDILHKNGHTSDPEMTHHLAQVAPHMVHWLADEVGVDLIFIDDFKYPGHSEYRMVAPPSRTGAALVRDLRRAVHAHARAELITDAVVTDLVVENKGAGGEAVVGVVVQHGAREEWVRCSKVILACNGFAGNADMVAQYCPAMSDALYFGGEGNTGEGILWGMALGAEVAFMDAYQAHASVAMPHAILITYALIMEGGFQVNQEGYRFGDETSGYSEHALAVLAQPGGVAWDIYDERLHRLGLQFEEYREALEAGAIQRAESIEQLAGLLGLPPQSLAQTLQTYEACATGHQADPFGRQDCRHLQAPFYGVRVTGALFHTQGGLRVDLNGRVLRHDGRPVPNLYAGGGVAAGVSGHGPGGYLSGNGLLTALGYGMLAGRHAARTLQEAKRDR